MRLIRIGAAVLNQTPLAWEQNRRNIERAIAAARAAKVSILCLPELCITGYGCEDAFLSPAVQATALDVLEEIAPHAQDIAVSVGLPVFVQSRLYNTACLLANGGILGFAAKRFLPAEGLHYEPRWFRAWPPGARAEVERNGRRHPLGDLMFALGDVNVGFEICEDAWVAPRPGLALARRGVDVILNPTASHFAFGKHEVRKRLVQEGSRSLGVAYAFANLLGNEAGRAIYDGDALIAACGELLAEGPRFSFADVQLTAAVVDIDRCRQRRTVAGGIDPDLSGDIHRVVCDFAFPALAPEAPRRDGVPPPPATKEEEFARATGLGLFDYLRKSRNHGFVVSLSGGADSAACACLVAIAVELALAELGRDGVLARLGHVPGLRQAKGARELTRALLTTVYQSTANSSAATREAARTIAESLGARHLELDVDDIAQRYVAIAGKALGRGLDWQHDDLALQNVQARARAPGVWLIANLSNALLLACSNRSEAAVGYATMDGDTCGGLSPIAGIDKTYLRAWLRWLERDGPSGLHPFPGLAKVNAQVPTAELRPPAAKQSDEDDLMPYPVLDAMERAAIRDKQSPREVWLSVRQSFPEHAEAKLAEWVERFFRLWARNQWKRERYAPSFHLDDENLDPKTWCRFPILSGGFEREIDEMRRR